MMYDSILLPIDGSEGSAEATEHAVDLASKYDASVHGLVVVDQSAYVGLASDIEREQTREAEVKDAEELATNLADTLDDANLDHETTVVTGLPDEEIVDRAETVDLIVMGTHGRSGIDRFLLGSTTEKVLRRVTVPVHCVPVAEE